MDGKPRATKGCEINPTSCETYDSRFPKVFLKTFEGGYLPLPRYLREVVREVDCLALSLRRLFRHWGFQHRDCSRDGIGIGELLSQTWVKIRGRGHMTRILAAGERDHWVSWNNYKLNKPKNSKVISNIGIPRLTRVLTSLTNPISRMLSASCIMSHREIITMGTTWVRLCLYAASELNDETF